MGNNLYRCSVHSVRPLSDRERAVQEISSREPVSKWKQLTDLIPSREYTDLEHEQPDEDEREEPELILPDEAPQVPVRRSNQPAVRFYQKDSMDNRGLPQKGITSMIPPAVNEYGGFEEPMREEAAEDTGTICYRRGDHGDHLLRQAHLYYLMEGTRSWKNNNRNHQKEYEVMNTHLYYTFNWTSS